MYQWYCTGRGNKRTDLPWIEPSDEMDEDFIRFVENYNIESRPMVMELLYKYRDKEIIF